MRPISIIIPIYNSDKYLSNLFKSLDELDISEEDEILLVDNGSDDLSGIMCKKQSKKYPHIYKYLNFNEKAGSYATRNYAIKQSKGDILVFTDSDTKPSKDWIKAIRMNIKEGVLIAGKIQLEVTSNDLWENFDNIAHLNSEKNAEKNCVATANMAVFKKDFYKVGYFEERFSGGDYDWSIRAKKSGLDVVFVPEALVYHPTRKTFYEILIKEKRIAYGTGNHYRIQNKSFFKMVLVYILKIFKVDIVFKYIIQLKKVGVPNKNIIKFIIYFLKIRIEQLKYVIKGYNMFDVRKLNIK